MGRDLTSDEDLADAVALVAAAMAADGEGARVLLANADHSAVLAAVTFLAGLLAAERFCCCGAFREWAQEELARS